MHDDEKEVEREVFDSTYRHLEAVGLSAGNGSNMLVLSHSGQCDADRQPASDPGFGLSFRNQSASVFAATATTWSKR